MNETLLKEIKETKEILNEQFGITKLAVFGSYAKGEENENSDIDIVILEMKRKNGLLVVKAKKFLQERLNKEVDIGFYSSMNPFIKKRIQKEMINV